MEKSILVSPNCSDLASPNFEIKFFPDRENFILVPNLDSLKGKHVFLLHRCYPNPNKSVVQLFQILYAVQPHAEKITAIIPYLPYSRQDAPVKPGECASAEMLCRMLKNAGVDELITFDCHFIKEGPGKYVHEGLNITNKSMGPSLIDYFKENIKEPFVISPDKGSAYLVKKETGVSMAKVLGDYVKGQVTFRPITSEKLDFDVSGKNVVILDDLIAAGRTMISAAQACKKGKAKKIFCAAVHGILVDNAFDRIRAAGASEILVSDSVPSPAAVVSISRELREYLSLQ